MTTNTTVPPNQAGAPPTKSITRFFPAVARVLMGLIFLVFGLNGFLNFVPQPKTPVPEGALAFVGAMMKTGYMIRLIAGTQVLVGVLLLTNCFVPLALAIIAPVIVNIIAFHLFLSTLGMPLAVLVLVLEIYLAWVYRHTFRSMLTMRATPNAT
ncbi:MAG TPA: hypothetical protein VFQ18_06495 [Candidatus Acidoferrum sp.]|nr:hypothetical protein [Candidatus Acidoferrum sp.]